MQPLCSSGHVVVVTFGWPPLAGGSSVLMRNLLEGFDPDSFTIVTAQVPHKKGLELSEHSVIRVMGAPANLPPRLRARMLDLQYPYATLRIVQAIRRTSAVAVVAAYPNLHLLGAARRAAEWTGRPLVSYLHDTIVEANANHRLYAGLARRLERQVFADSDHIFVMSEGMSDLYKRRLQLDTTPLQHTYAEPIPDDVPTTEAERCALWVGNVYNINQNAVGRVCRALGQAGIDLEVASRDSLEVLAKKGISGAHVRTSFYAGRAAYLEALRHKGLLLLCLDGSDESPIHADELGTIFPTKTPEYLASGRPILAHCPEDWFLARYIRKHGCGLVVSDPSEDAIAEAALSLLEDTDRTHAMSRRALVTAQQFAAGPLRERFQAVVERAAEHGRA